MVGIFMPNSQTLCSTENLEQQYCQLQSNAPIFNYVKASRAGGGVSNSLFYHKPSEMMYILKLWILIDPQQEEENMNRLHFALPHVSE